MPNEPKQLQVITDEGLQTMLAALVEKIGQLYLKKTNLVVQINNALDDDTLKDKIIEIIEDSNVVSSGLGFCSFKIDETTGHLMLYYTGQDTINASVDEETGHLLINF